MPDYYEIDFRQVHTVKSGDAIAIRYQIGNQWAVHLVDGGYTSTALEVANFIRNKYETSLINHVVVTHPDRDHAEGLAPILEHFDVGTLWMLCPWHYAGHILSYFPQYQSVESLARRLQSEYPYIHELEKIALRRKIDIRSPFQDERINSQIAQVSDYWIFDFLDSDFQVTPAAGTRRLGVALRNAAKKSEDINVKSEIAAAVTLAGSLKGKKTSIRDFEEGWRWTRKVTIAERCGRGQSEGRATNQRFCVPVRRAACAW